MHTHTHTHTRHTHTHFLASHRLNLKEEHRVLFGPYTVSCLQSLTDIWLSVRLHHFLSPEASEYCKWADSTKTNTFFYNFIPPTLFALFTFLLSSLCFSPHFSKSECISTELERQTSSQVLSAPRALSSEGQPYPVTYSRPHTISLPWQPWLISPTTLQGQLHKKGTCSHCTISHK